MKKLLIALCLLSSPAWATAIAANAGTCTTPANWNQASSWTPAQVPVAGDTVTIGSTFGIQVTDTEAAQTLTQSNSANCLYLNTSSANLAIGATTSGNVWTIGTYTGTGGPYMFIDKGANFHFGNSPATPVFVGTIQGTNTKIDVHGTFSMGGHTLITGHAKFVVWAYSTLTSTPSGTGVGSNYKLYNNETVLKSPMPYIVKGTDLTGWGGTNGSPPVCGVDPIFCIDTVGADGTNHTAIGASTAFLHVDLAYMYGPHCGVGPEFPPDVSCIGGNSWFPPYLNLDHILLVGPSGGVGCHPTTGGTGDETNHCVVTNSDFRELPDTYAVSYVLTASVPTAGPGTRLRDHNTFWSDNTIGAVNVDSMQGMTDTQISNSINSVKELMVDNTSMRTYYLNNIYTRTDVPTSTLNDFMTLCNNCGLIVDGGGVMESGNKIDTGSDHIMDIQNANLTGMMPNVIQNVVYDGNFITVGTNPGTSEPVRGGGVLLVRNAVAINGFGHLINCSPSFGPNNIIECVVSHVTGDQANTTIAVPWLGEYEAESHQSPYIWGAYKNNMMSRVASTVTLGSNVSPWVAQDTIDCNIDTTNPIVVTAGPPPEITVPTTGCTGTLVVGEAIHFPPFGQTGALTKAFWLNGETLWADGVTGTSSFTAPLCSANTLPTVPVCFLSHPFPTTYSVNESAGAVLHGGFWYGNSGVDSMTTLASGQNRAWNSGTQAQGGYFMNSHATGTGTVRYNLTATTGTNSTTLVSTTTNAGTVLGDSLYDASTGSSLNAFVTAVNSSVSLSLGPCPPACNSNGGTGLSSMVSGHSVRVYYGPWGNNHSYGDPLWYGAGEKPLPPRYRCNACNTGTWDASLGGPGTLSHARDQIFQMNGFTASATPVHVTYNPAYNIRDWHDYIFRAYGMMTPQSKNSGTDGYDIGVQWGTFPAAMIGGQ